MTFIINDKIFTVSDLKILLTSDERKTKLYSKWNRWGFFNFWVIVTHLFILNGLKQYYTEQELRVMFFQLMTKPTQYFQLLTKCATIDFTVSGD